MSAQEVVIVLAHDERRVLPDDAKKKLDGVAERAIKFGLNGRQVIIKAAFSKPDWGKVSNFPKSE